ncbi:hypothetical protein KKA93_02335 [Patescibacteria group bacterium]|nr:hypothetical protein [Patescibacteria group bacterium]MBU1663646.1 hypothetical protein [Patescibacteria group bacterium]MBU1934223.1 hypothetical protein [Patescibacteria group bacterium]MBU2007938.1 hypothetical protein [Patescibacteria group bacterium]MBU2233281.1 hypothetical protein [Patescibacteria group bacterium]
MIKITKKSIIKLTLKKLSGLAAEIIILITLIILIFMSLFLYKNFYQAIAQTKKIIILREKVIMGMVDMAKLNIVIDKVTEKTKPNELKNIISPFR